MYLKGSEINKSSLLTEWKGRKGKFVRTFGIDTTRNNNKWRVTWASIKKNIHTALEPLTNAGIEFELCTQEGCDLDHVEADTFNEVVEKQKPFKKTNIIDYVLNEDTQSADLIDEVIDDDFWEKLENGDIQYVSPMIWPHTGGYEVLGIDGATGKKIIDAWDWHFVHKAYLKNSPAYGTDKANIKSMCEGENCQIQMLSAKETKSTNEYPMIVRHQGHLHYLSASEKVQQIIKKKKEAGIEIDDQAIAIAYSEAGESNKAKSSFKTCTCDKKQKLMSVEENKIKELEGKLKGMEDEKKDFQAKLKGMEDDKDKTAMYSKLKAKFTAMFKGMDEKEREHMKAKLAGMEDEEHMKAMDEVHKEMKAKEDGNGNDNEMTKLKARVEKMESTNLPLMIDGLMALKASSGTNQKSLREYHTALLGKDYSDVEKLYDSDSIIIKGLPAKATKPENFEFSEETSSLKGKSSEEILAEASK